MIAPWLAGTLRLQNGFEWPGTDYDIVTPPGYVPAPEASPIDKLAHLFPLEGVAIFPFFMAWADGDPVRQWAGLAAICAMVFSLRVLATRSAESGRPDWLAAVVSVVSFILYAGAHGAFGSIFGDPKDNILLFAGLSIAWLAYMPFMDLKPAFVPAPPPAETQ